MNLAHAFWYGLWAAAAWPSAAPWIAGGALVAAALARRGRAPLLAAATAAACMGALLPWARLPPSPRLAGEGSWTLRVIGSPEARGEGQLWTGSPPDSRARYEVRIQQGRVAALAAGAWVRVRGELEEFPGKRNPGGPDLRALAVGRGASARIRVRLAEGVSILRPAPPPISFAESVRDSARALLERRLGPRASPYARALFLGESADLSEDDREGLVALGIIHIVIVAGLHLHLLHGAASRACTALAPGARFVLPFALTAGYAALSGMHLPARRVLLSLALSEIARKRGEPHSGGVGAAMAASALLLMEPWRGRDASYVLSAAATWAIHQLPVPRPHRSAGRPALELLRASALAQAGAWSVLPWTVGHGSLAGLPANLLAVPLAASALLTGACALGLEWLFSPAAGPAWRILDLLGSCLSGLAHWGSSVRGLDVPLACTSATCLIAYALSMLALAHAPVRSRTLSWIVFCAATITMCLGGRASPSPAPNLRVAFLDVGQGDACLVTFPRGESVLVDGGSRRPEWDSGTRVVRPALDALGIGPLVWAAASHSDNDHSGGLGAVAARPGAARWLVPPPSPGARWEPLFTAIRDVGQKAEPVGAGWVWVDRTGRDTVRALSPDSAAMASNLSENDQCLVFEVATPEGRVLLTGDLETEGESRLVAGGKLRAVSILKVAHHGSRNSSTTGFLCILGRPVAVISVGARNPYHHPSPEVEVRLSDAGCRVLETRREGAVLLELRKEGVRRVDEGAWSLDRAVCGPPGRVP